MRKTLLSSIFVAATGLSVSSQTVPTINACVNNLNGATRVVASSVNCINGVETFKQWSVTGPQGPQGVQGPDGPQGPQGIIGPQGQRGSMGLTGPMGNTGAQGVKGDTGAQGAAGQQGVAGPAGPQGPRGELGTTGNNGAQGEKGPAGPSGPTGPAGPAGGQVWSAVTTLPGNTSPREYLFSASGQSIPTAIGDPLNVALPVPVSCTARDFKATLIGGSGPMPEAVFFTTPVTAANLQSMGFSEGPRCMITPNNDGTPASCSIPGVFETLTAGNFIAIGFSEHPADSSASAHLMVSFTCE